MQPRVLRPAPDPLGTYLRPGRRDHKALTQLLVEGMSVGTGLIADPVLVDLHGDLLGEAARQGVETVLDPRSVDLSTPGGFARSGVTDLPWAGAGLHTVAGLTGAAGGLLARQLATVVEERGLSAALAPTHYLPHAGHPWLAVDVALTRALRRELDSRGLTRVPIYYPLVGRASMLRDPDQRAQVIAALTGLPIDALWIRLHPFGTGTSGPLALRRYLEICRELHALNVPLVAEHSGTVGVALLAFGAVGGIESGVTFSDKVNLDALLKAPRPDAKPFAPPPRLYLHEIGAFLDTATAPDFFNARN